MEKPSTTDDSSSEVGEGTRSRFVLDVKKGD